MKSKKNIILDPSDKFIAGLNNMRNLPATPEATWEITFDNDSTIFIAGRDEAHARRVLENNKGLSRWRRTPECEWQIRTIKKIERVTW